MPAPGRPTHRDIARAAGVSNATVSLALRGHPRIAAATRARVRAAARRLGYRERPGLSLLMRRIRGGDTTAGETLALVSFAPLAVLRDRGPAWREFLDGARHRAASLGARLDDFVLGPEGLAPARLRRVLQTRGIRGLLVAAHPEPLGELPFDLDGFAAITFGYTVARPALHRVINHNYLTVRLAADAVLARGYRRPALLVTPEAHERAAHLWLASFRDWQHTLTAADRLPPFLGPPDPTALAAWCARHRPDVALGIGAPWWETLAAAGLAIPEDLGFATLDLAADTPGLAGVDQRHSHAGRVAIDLLLGALYHHELGPPEIPLVTNVPGAWHDAPSLPVR